MFHSLPVALLEKVDVKSDDWSVQLSFALSRGLIRRSVSVAVAHEEYGKLAGACAAQCI